MTRASTGANGAANSAAEGRAPSLDEVVRFLNELLDIPNAPDYPGAVNGLQVGADGPVRRVAAAVDARELVLDEAAEWADLIVVHHGLFWGGLRPLTGPLYRRVRTLFANRAALYSAHLPLDAHPVVGNAAVLARTLGLAARTPFGSYQGSAVGWSARTDTTLAALRTRLAEVLKGDVRLLAGGPDEVRTVGIVTGAGASLLPEAAAAGIDVLITGEAQHHHAIDAAELGVSLLLGGHYATETWGVRALGELLAERFGVETRFVDAPTGM